MVQVGDYRLWLNALPTAVDEILLRFSIRQSGLLVAEFGHNMRKSEEGQEIRRAVAARVGRCTRCGGQVVGRISFPGDPPERRCVQCGRPPTPAYVEVSYTPVPENEWLPVALAQE